MKAPLKHGEKPYYRNKFDYTMLIVTIVLIFFGVLMVYSSSYYRAENRGSSAETYFIKQLECVALGAVFMVIAMFFDYHKFLAFKRQKNGDNVKTYDNPFVVILKKIRPYHLVLLFGIVALLLVFSPLGVTINSSRRWINIGFSIQPSEILKLCLIVFIAASIFRNPDRIKNFWKGFLPYFILLAVLAVPLLKQPNYSALICMALLTFMMLCVAGAKGKHLLIVALAGVAALSVFGLMPDADGGYRLARILGLKDPGWQLTQSLYSFGSGGMFGRGLGNSMQKMLYLPMSDSDFIFSIIAEELGFVGAGCVLALYLVLIWRGVLAAMRAQDLMGRLIASGISAVIAMQVVINVGVTLGIVPTTGVVLPFLSSGGSGTIVFMTMSGFLENIARQGVVVPDTENVPLKRKKEKRAAEEIKEAAVRVSGSAWAKTSEAKEKTVAAMRKTGGNIKTASAALQQNDKKKMLKMAQKGKAEQEEKKLFAHRKKQKDTGSTYLDI